jgi:hypothetical protein
MEFQALCDLFKTINPIKRKYPAVGYYYKHLQKIESSPDKEAVEVECAKHFLIQNPSLRDRVLDENTMNTGKSSLVCGICFENVFTLGSEEMIEAFWSSLFTLEDILFPDGKPEPPLDGSPEGAEGGGPMSVLENNPVLKDVIDQVKTTAACMGPDDDITTIFQSPSFSKIVKTIKGNLEKGKYKLSDITGTITNVLGSINTGEMDETSKNALNTISGAMAMAEQGQAPDMTGLMDMVSNLKFN